MRPAWGDTHPGLWRLHLAARLLLLAEHRRGHRLCPDCYHCAQILSHARRAAHMGLTLGPWAYNGSQP